MKTRTWVVATVSCAAGVVAAAAEEHATSVPLPSLIESARERNRAYVAPTESERATFRAGAAQLLAAVGGAAPPRTPPATFAEVGFDVRPTELGGARALAIVERAERRRGGGLYVYRTGQLAHERIIQVPHSFFDEGTLAIGLELAEAGAARALFVNTVHRYQAGRPGATSSDESQPGTASPSDVAHQAGSFFQAMTESALTTLSAVEIVQVHGFSSAERGPRARADVVVSAGAARAGSDEAARVAARLGALLGRTRVQLFPRDTKLLGALTNAQGGAVARHPPAIFIHLELSRPLRDRLAADAELRRSFARAVFGDGGG